MPGARAFTHGAVGDEFVKAFYAWVPTISRRFPATSTVNVGEKQKIDVFVVVSHSVPAGGAVNLRGCSLASRILLASHDVEPACDPTDDGKIGGVSLHTGAEG